MKRPKLFESEVELCGSVVQWLQSQHWDVYQEVEMFSQGSRADIIAVRSSVIWVIEAKLSLSVSLIEQAYGWKQYTNYISVLTPLRNRNLSGAILLTALGIGTIEVGKDCRDKNDIRSDLGKFNRIPTFFKDRIPSVLKPEMQTGEHGKAGNNTSSRWTPYKQTMLEIKRFLVSNGPSTLKQIIQNLNHHYSSDKSALPSIRKALEVWEGWCCVDYSKKQYLYSIKANDLPEDLRVREMPNE